MGFEVSTLIGVGSLWHSVASEPFTHQKLPHGCCLFISGPSGDGEFGKPISDNQDVFHPVVGLSNKVKSAEIISRGLIAASLLKYVMGGKCIWSFPQTHPSQVFKNCDACLVISENQQPSLISVSNLSGPWCPAMS